MPHTRQPPITISEILATADFDQAWSDALDEAPVPSGADWGDDYMTLKNLSEGMLPRLRASLDASRPSDITEQHLYINIPSTDLQPQRGRNRVVVCHHSNHDDNSNSSSPVIVFFHGGGQTIGYPENELLFARQLVQQFNAVVVLPAYRLAPEYVFPSGFSDAFEVVKMVAKDIQAISASAAPSAQSTAPPSQVKTQILKPGMFHNLSTDLIIGGVSAGATLSSSVNHLYRSWRMSQQASQRHKVSSNDTHTTRSPPLPQISGLFLSSGSYINPSAVPPAYKPFYLSRDQNATTLPLDREMYALFANAAKTDWTNPIWSSFDQQGGGVDGKVRDRVGEDHAWMAESESGSGENGNQKGIRVYFQVSGADISRDDSLIYERVLREECKVETRLDLYTGFGHCFWGMSGPYAALETSKQRLKDSVEAIGWLLRR